jgi:hypothetical protein
MQVPLKPHGDIIGYLTAEISEALGRRLPGSTFTPVSDNGMSAHFDCDANCEDTVLNVNSKKDPTRLGVFDVSVSPIPGLRGFK